MAAVSADGSTTAPLIIQQGVRHLAAFLEGWPEAKLAMDDAGYMTQEIFFAWAKWWEELTRPADPAQPRTLFLDNHYSHLGLDALLYLREHNVRVVGLHPHTTHLLCALDCGIFLSFKSQLAKSIVAWQATNKRTIDRYTISGCMKQAWGITTTISVNSVTQERTSIPITAFKTVGLVPFNEHAVDEKHYAANDAFKAANDAAGGGGAPYPVKMPLTLSAADFKSIAEELAGGAGLAGVVKEKAASRRPVVMSQLLTFTGCLEGELDKQKVKDDAEHAKVGRAEKKKVDLEARGGLSVAAFTKQESQKKKEAKAAAALEAAKQAAEAAAATASAAAAATAKKQPVKSSRRATAAASAEPILYGPEKKKRTRDSSQ